MEEEGRGAVATVKSILVYPIKSCRGLSLSQAPISSTGFRWDRQWLVVNPKGRAYTQRVEPKLALVQVELPNEAFSVDWQPNKHSYLVIRGPGMDVLKVPLSKSAEKVEGVSVWEWSGSAVDEGAAAAQWFSNYLGKPSRLVRFNDASEVRNVDPNYVRGYKVMFCDGYPFLLLSQGSLNALNALLKEPLPANRFRPKKLLLIIIIALIKIALGRSILVDGCEPFSEDLWTEIKINKSTFQGVKLCSRCKVPTINQETAVGGSEPTETLMSFRSDRVLRSAKKNPWEGNEKSIKVGDPVFVLKMVSSAADAAA
ncbi:hypothetical protein DH2020_047978 [Rehmannia glutinosa]|uniref:MOSC domain-containing protein n=1 Tax=Rehmannia glutinosa TaxID=99300 RepID=A0ABR0U815_REHGL